MSATEFTRELSNESIEYELIHHPPGDTARQEAIDVGLSEFGKTLVVATERGFVRAVIPAGERLDLHKLRHLLGGVRTVRLATEDELTDTYPMFDLGAVPPFGGPHGDRAVIDRRLAALESMVLQAGSHTEAVRLRTRDVIRLAEAVIADICED